MHTRFRLLALMLFVSLLIVALGCSDDDDDTAPTQSNTTDLDTQFTLFGWQFEGIEEGTGEMLGMIFLHLDEIMQPVGSGKLHRPNQAAFSIDYHSDSKFWVIRDTLFEDDTIGVVDSIQFIEDTDTVQYPDGELITEIRSFLTVTFHNDNITTGEMYQNVVITTTTTPSDTIFINGTGGGTGDLIDVIDKGTDTTTCDVYMDATWTVTDLTIIAPIEDGPPCPVDGTVAFTVTVDIDCTGDITGSTAGTWTATLDFVGGGQMNFLYEFGDASWPRTASCN